MNIWLIILNILSVINYPSRGLILACQQCNFFLVSSLVGSNGERSMYCRLFVAPTHILITVISGSITTARTLTSLRLNVIATSKFSFSTFYACSTHWCCESVFCYPALETVKTHQIVIFTSNMLTKKNVQCYLVSHLWNWCVFDSSFQCILFRLDV